MKSETEMGTLKKELSPTNSPRTNRFPHNSSNMSNNGSAMADDETLIKDKPSHKALNVLSLPSPKKRLSQDNVRKKYSVELEKPIVFPSFQNKLGDFLRSKVADLSILTLIAAYAVLVFISLVADDGCSNSQKMHDGLLAMEYIELGIFSAFIAEIFLRMIAFGISGYFKDVTYFIDPLITVITFVLCIIDVKVTRNHFDRLRRLHGVFNLFRIILLMRKASEFSRIAKKKARTTGLGLKSPVEKVLELLETYKRSTLNTNLKKDIDWAIEVVSSNQLYDPLLSSQDGKGGDKSNVEVWLKSYNQQHKTAEERNTPNRASLAKKYNFGMPSSMALNYSKSTGALTISPAASEYLTKNLDLMTFNIFEYKKMSENQELSSMMLFLFERHHFFDTLNIKQETFIRFSKKVQEGYLSNTYHNSSHGADVLQTINYYLTTGELMLKADLNDIDVASLFIAAAVHDIDHPGTNNAFQINTSSSYALKYNDKSCLENHHVSYAFALMKGEQSNIFENFSKEDYKTMREKIIANVLATDMSNHFSDMAKLKGRLAADIDVKDKDKKFIMEIAVHAADISNPSKPWDLCKEWSLRVVAEFFDQGDKERNLSLPVSHLCDRYTTNIAKSQLGFIDFVVAPLFGLLTQIMPKVDISGFETNKGKWKELIDHFDQELKDLNDKKNAEEKKETPGA